MMTSAQSCLITSFFKSPPNGKETCLISAEKSNTGDATHKDPDQSDHRFAEDRDSDSSNGDSSSGSDEESERKPLVVNLCGLLSSEVMNGSRGMRKTVRPAQKQSASQAVGAKEEELQPKSRKATGADLNSGASNLNSGQESSLGSKDGAYSVDLSQESNDALVNVPPDVHFTSTVTKSSQMKQCVFSWNSKSRSLDLSVPVEPPKTSNSEDLGDSQEGAASRGDREEGSAGVMEEGAGEVDTTVGVDGRVVISTNKQGGKRKDSGSDRCEDGSCLQEEPGILTYLPKQKAMVEVIPEDIVTGSGEGGFGGDDSFEDFVASIKQKRGRRKRKLSSRKTPEEIEDEIDGPRTVPSQQPTECSSADSTSDGELKPGKRPRRSAAVSANARISSSRRSRRSSVEEKRSGTKISTVDCQQTSAEPDPRNVTHHSRVTLNSDLNHDLESIFHNQDVNVTPVCTTLDSDHENETQVFELEDKECEGDSSIIFVSSTPPTTSPIKHSSPLKPTASGTATSAGLSAAWAKIFSRPNKVQTSEAVSTVKEKTIGSPVKGVKKRRTPSNSPRRHGSPSPSRSPRKVRSPRRDSPLRVRSPRKSSLLHSSPLREARCPHPASRQLAFSGSSGRGDSCVVDSAPFEGVVHVQQIDPSCELWKLGAPKSIPVVRSFCRENVDPELLTPVAGGLGLCATQASAGCSDSMTTSHIQLCSKEENDRILKQLEEAHPQRDVRGIFARYARIATPPSTGTGSQTSPEGKPSSKPKMEKKLNTRRTEHSLKCSIRIRHGSRSAKDSKITVDTATYQKRGRRSLRLAKKSQESISEDAELAESTLTDKIKDNTQPSKPRPAASTNAVTKPPAFVLDPWTEVYRPQGSSEVIGNGAQVEKLRVWLSAWKTRCCSQKEGEQKPPTKVDKKERSDGTGSCKFSEKGDPRVQEPGVRHDAAVPWWVSEKDRDFISISHLCRKRCRAPKCLDSSESGGETSGEEDDDSLCPVTLLCGPHGSGKSAAAYVCAQELGFKVFEVNSSGIRSRQTIMSTLREATLSHQVVMATHSKPAQVTGHITNFFGRSKCDPSKGTKVCKDSNLPLNSGGLYSFFKPKKTTKSQSNNKPASTSSQRDTSQMMRSDGASSRAELQTGETKKRRKSRTNSIIAIEDVSCPSATEHSQSANSVSLATATVILLDEVDILFDEDKGFWSAVYELIATTKRPIIMTCNDPRYDLECDHQKLLFSRPPIPELSLHMQLLCLSHGAHMTSETANQIAAFLNCDIRKVMNCLQFWLSLLSGDIIGERQQLESASNVGEVVSEDQSTRSCARSPDNGRKEDLCLTLEHLLGFSVSQRRLLKRIQKLRNDSVDPGLLCGVLETLHRNGLEVAHPLHWLQSTPAQEQTATCASSPPTSTVGSPSASVDIDTCSDLSRIGSSPSQTQPIARDSDNGNAQEFERSPADECFFSAPWRYRGNLKIASKNQYLDALSNFSDTLSHMDTIAMTSCDSHRTWLPAAWWKCELETGLLDELPLSGRGDCWRAEITRTSEGIVGVAEGLSLGAWQRRMKKTGSCGELYSLASRAENQRRADAVHSSLIKCSGVFTPHWELSHVAMATDGLPVLQLICHSENLREAAHVKRRFRHHLQASTVDLCDLKALPRAAAFLSTSHPA